MSLEDRAKAFATRHHGAIGQVRKYSGEPYINHPIAVAALVKSVPHTKEMIAAAYLHDTVEDTAATIDEVRDKFGNEVATLVSWLTDVSKPEDGNRVKRKAIDAEHTAKAPGAAKTVKLADLIDNSRSILSRDPGFAKVYLDEKRRLLKVLREGDRTLWEMAYQITLTG